MNGTESMLDMLFLIESFHFVQVKLPLKQDLSQSPPFQQFPFLKHIFSLTTPLHLNVQHQSQVLFMYPKIRNHIWSQGGLQSLQYDALCP